MNTTYNYNVLRVNLTDKSWQTESFGHEEANRFIGGRGLATKWLYDAGCAKADPLSPENLLIFANGPLTGTNSPTGGRYMVITKQPLNNMIGSANSGGTWGARLKYAGYDAIIFEGKADSPIRLFIEDDHVELIDASDIWGMKSTECNDKLQEMYGSKANSLYIGPAGEQLSLLACIMNDTDRAAGRGGVGAVMGSKNLKAITVKASNTIVNAYDKEAMKVAFQEAMAKIRANPVTSEGLPGLGTAILINVINGIGALPTKNWQKSYFEDAEKISGEELAENYLVRKGHCHRCPIGCGRVIKRNDKEIGGPEYEPLWAYGSNCNVNDLAAVNEANFQCNEYGLDAIGAPATIAAAMELVQRDLIKEDEFEGLPALVWGSSEAIVEWTKAMGEGKVELAKKMAQGSANLCESYDAAQYSMSSKRMELPAYDARAIQGIGLNYATSNRGGCHVRGYTISPEVLGLPEQADRTETEGKAALVKIFQDLTAVIDSLGLCLFTSFALGAPEYTALYNAATGSNLSVEELLEAGDRIFNLERLFNKDAGMVQSDDSLPTRLIEEPVSNGPSKGMLSKLDEMLPAYYAERGWVDGFPTEETLQRLGIA